MVIEKYKSGFQPPSDIPFDDLSCSRQSTLQAGGGDGGDRASVNGSVMGSISQVIIPRAVTVSSNISILINNHHFISVG